MIQAHTAKILEVRLVELALLDCEYASVTVMQSKKDNYVDNWIEERKCGDYWRINKFTKFDHHTMPTPKKNLKAVGYLYHRPN